MSNSCGFFSYIKKYFLHLHFIMDLVKLNIRGISYSQTQVGAYALILEEQAGNRKLPIIIGNFEAQAIAIALEKDLKPPRPLTHDLFTHFIQKIGAEMLSVTIYKLEEGIFYSSILFEDKDGRTFEIDSRTSDAIALAVRFGAPIYAYKNVVDKAGISIQIITEEDEKEANEALQGIEEELNQIIDEVEDKTDSAWDEYTTEQIEDIMKKAVKDEDYELAAQLRDELDKRTK